jgi:NADH dehydrogenase
MAPQELLEKDLPARPPIHADGRPHVVIIGGGFGGLYAARALKNAPVRISLVDRHNHHLFQPLLYQVATAALNPSDIAVPIRRIVRDQRNCDVIMAEATGIDTKDKRVFFADGSDLRYDYLIVATGARHAYFGNDQWAPLAPGLKTIDDALDIRRRILLAYEAAERETDPQRRKAWLTFIVVGAGPTGVELCGSLAEIARHVLAHDFRHIDPRTARVVLVEAGPRILNSFSEPLAQKAVESLERLGVQVLTGRPVKGIDEHGVDIGGERVPARTVLWAAGVAGSPLAKTLGVPLDRAGRVVVQPDLSIPGHPEIFVIGDLASFMNQGTPLPGVAPVAIQQGRWAARNIVRAVAGKTMRPFSYHDRGTLAIIGRAAAIAQKGPVKASGLWAWLLWLFVHILWLIGFRNRFLVVAQWAWTYLSFERGARLITGNVCTFGKGSAQREPTCIVATPPCAPMASRLGVS